MKTYSFRTIIEPDDPKGYHGYVPSLPGVHTCGDTIEEVKINLKDAIACHVQGLLKDKLSIPQETDALESIQTFSETDFTSYQYA
jgi:predicted RNase H-like HicB family nuclease